MLRCNSSPYSTLFVLFRGFLHEPFEIALQDIYGIPHNSSLIYPALICEGLLMNRFTL